MKNISINNIMTSPKEIVNIILQHLKENFMLETIIFKLNPEYPLWHPFTYIIIQGIQRTVINNNEFKKSGLREIGILPFSAQKPIIVFTSNVS